MARVKRAYPAIDIGKYISALLVLAIHVYPFVEISPVFNTFFIATICRLAVPFFFVTSGFFFAKKLFARPFDENAMLKNYLIRIGRLYLVWTIIYLPYTIWNYMDTGFSWYNIISYLRDFLLNGSYYHLWFLPALMLGMCIVFFSVRYLGYKKSALLTLILYVLGYIINIYSTFWASWKYTSLLYGFFTKTLVTSRDGIFFAPVFLLMGFILAKGYRLDVQKSAIAFAVSFVGLVLEVSFYYMFGILHDLSSMFLFLLPCAYFLVSLLLGLKIKNSPQYKILRLDSTVIYTSQILFVRIFLILLPQAHLVVYFLSLACAQALSAFIIRFKDRIKVLNYLV
jgi:peptidoglycan/LPS O-acetylase OafA/YrhL